MRTPDQDHLPSEGTFSRLKDSLGIDSIVIPGMIRREYPDFMSMAGVTRQLNISTSWSR